MLSRTLIALSIASFGLASPLLSKRASWANFYSGTGCTGDEGEGVDVYNPGCLGEGGRQSLQVWKEASGEVCLQAWNAGGCPNTAPDWSTTLNVSPGPHNDPPSYCIGLDPDYQSYSFINGPC